MKIVLMEHETDCEVAAIATACQVSYDKAESALGWVDLPGGLENPVFGNPINLHKALLKLGFWKKNITLSQLLKGECTTHKTVVLLKKSHLQQHWVVYAGQNGDYIGFWWGNDAENPKWVTKATAAKWFTQDGPVNEAFEVYKCSFWRLLWERLKGIFK